MLLVAGKYGEGEDGYIFSDSCFSILYVAVL